MIYNAFRETILMVCCLHLGKKTKAGMDNPDNMNYYNVDSVKSSLKISLTWATATSWWMERQLLIPYIKKFKVYGTFSFLMKQGANFNISYLERSV